MATTQAPTAAAPNRAGPATPVLDAMEPYYDAYVSIAGKRQRVILMNTGHLFAVSHAGGWCCSASKWVMDTRMVITPGPSCVAVADISDDSARLFRVAGPAGSVALTANDGADRDHWLRLIARLKGMLEESENPVFTLLRSETRLRREFLEEDWPYGKEPARVAVPTNVHDDDLTAAELKSRFEHKNEAPVATRKRPPNPLVNVTFFGPPCPDHEEALSRYGQRTPMRDTMRARLCAAIDAARVGKTRCVLVVDEVAARAISKVLHVTDLTRLGIKRVELLEQKRDHLHKYHAIYMIAPSFQALGDSEEAALSTEFSRKFVKTVRTAQANTPTRRRALSMFAKRATMMEDGGVVSDGEDAPPAAGAFTDDESDGRTPMANGRGKQEEDDDETTSSDDSSDLSYVSDSSDAEELMEKADIMSKSPRTRRKLMAARLARKAEERRRKRHMSAEQKAAEEAERARKEMIDEFEARPTVVRKTSFQLFMHDWKSKSGTIRKKRIYKSASLLMVSHADSAVNKTISSQAAQNGLGRWLRKAMVINSDFRAVESQVFHLDMQSACVPLFASDPSALGVDRNRTLQLIADRLVSVCVSMNEFPFIQFKASNPNNGTLASMVRDGLNAHLRDDPEFWFHGMSNERQQACLLILSRSDDIVSPLVHDFSYQSMVYDVYDVAPGGPIPAIANKAKVHKLDEADEVWRDFRHSHVNRVMHAALAAAERVERSPGKFLSPAGGANRQELLSEAMGVLPEMDAKHSSGRHLAIANHCLHVGRESNLEGVAELEQTLVTGCNHKGKVPYDRTLRKSLVKLLEAMEDEDERLRLITLYTLTRGGVSQSEWDTIVTKYLGEASIDTLKQLENFNVTVVRGAKQSVKKLPSQLLKQNKALAKRCKRPEDWLCRASPALFETVWRQSQGLLDSEAFPFLLDPPPSYWEDGSEADGVTAAEAAMNDTPLPDSTSQRSGDHHSTDEEELEEKQAPKLDRKHVTMNYDEFMLESGELDGEDTKAPDASTRPITPTELQVDCGDEPEQPKYHKPRLIVFVMGGVTFAETKAVYKLSKAFDQEVLLGGTNLINAKEFLQDLRVMSSAQARTPRVAAGGPHGLSGAGGAGAGSK